MLPLEGLDIGQHANGHQRILKHDFGNVTAVDADGDILACFFKPARRLAQDRHLRIGSRSPRIQGPAVRLIEHGRNFNKDSKKTR